MKPPESSEHPEPSEPSEPSEHSENSEISENSEYSVGPVRCPPTSLPTNSKFKISKFKII